MKVQFGRQSYEYDRAMTVKQLLRKLDIVPEGVVVAVNGALVTSDHRIEAEDDVEIIRAISGGRPGRAARAAPARPAGPARASASRGETTRPGEALGSPARVESERKPETFDFLGFRGERRRTRTRRRRR